MLRWRIISAIVIIAIFAGGCWLDLGWPLAGLGGLWLMPLGVLVTILATVEVCRMVFQRLTGLHLSMLVLANVLIFASGALPELFPEFTRRTGFGQLGWQMLLFSLATCFAFGEQMRTYRMGERAISRLGRTLLVLAYAGLLMSFFVALRIFGENPLGFVAFASMVLIVKLSDIGAYTVGRMIGGRVFGKTRLAPILSPKKTIEGSLGGLAFGCLGSYLSFYWLGPWVVGEAFVIPPPWAWLAYAIVLTIAGIFGDLAESLLKREAGAKDSSRWLPGLGGVLDIFDSLLFAAPLSYAMWALGIVSG